VAIPTKTEAGAIVKKDTKSGGDAAKTAAKADAPKPAGGAFIPPELAKSKAQKSSGGKDLWDQIIDTVTDDK
jgi:hypothetical protein